jgi:diguanylate cyclase (GGDEF)-like protein
MSKTAAYPPVDAVEVGGQNARRKRRVSGYYDLFALSPNATIVASMDYRVQYLNGPAAQLLQVDPDEVHILSLHSIFNECIRSHHYDLQQALMENGGRLNSMRVEVTGYRRQVTPCLLTVYPVQVNGVGYLVATLMDNSEVEGMTFSDPLTGIQNRRYFDEKIGKEYARLRRGDMDVLSLLFVDIDHFKQCNDTYGHRFADGVLHAVAQTMKSAARVNDSVCRFGGEELLVVLPGTDQEGAITFAERLRKAIAAIELEHPEQQVTVSVTASIGVATHLSEQAFDRTVGNPGSLIHQADAAMYRSKHAGRNRVTHYLDE